MILYENRMSVITINSFLNKASLLLITSVFVFIVYFFYFVDRIHIIRIRTVLLLLRRNIVMIIAIQSIFAKQVREIL